MPLQWNLSTLGFNERCRKSDQRVPCWGLHKLRETVVRPNVARINMVNCYESWRKSGRFVKEKTRSMKREFLRECVKDLIQENCGLHYDQLTQQWAEISHYILDRLVFVTRILSLFTLISWIFAWKIYFFGREWIIKFGSCLMKAWRGKHAKKRAKWQGIEESGERRQRRPKLPKLLDWPVWTWREND